MSIAFAQLLILATIWIFSLGAAILFKHEIKRMNVGDYITSGILQDYCLGILTNKEESKVEAICQAYPEVAMELLLLRLALEKYGGSEDILRRDQLRLAVWEAVRKIWEENHEL